MFLLSLFVFCLGCLKGALQREGDCGCCKSEQSISTLLANYLCASSRNQDIFNCGFKWLSRSNKLSIQQQKPVELSGPYPHYLVWV